MGTSYKDIFTEKYKDCDSKKDYKHLCKEMLYQFEVIDRIDENQWKLLSSIIGEEAYSRVLALAIKMYLLERQGISCDLLTIEERKI